VIQKDGLNCTVTYVRNGVHRFEVSCIFYNVFYTISTQQYISTVVYNIYNEFTLLLHVSTVNGHLQANKECFKDVLYWPEDDRLRSKHVAVMGPDYIYIYIISQY